MATTANYGWTTPDDTGYVKDGALAIRTLGNAIDTTVDSIDDRVDTLEANNIPKTLIDAKGDLLAGTAADTVSKLAVGTDGFFLSADSTTATGLKWVTAPTGSAPGLELITATDFSGIVSSINDCFSSTYENYRVIIRVDSQPTSNTFIRMRVSGSDATGTNYEMNYFELNGTTVSGQNYTYDCGVIAYGSVTYSTLDIISPNIAANTRIIFQGHANSRQWVGRINHAVSTAYTGFSISNTFTTSMDGRVWVYGYKKS